MTELRGGPGTQGIGKQDRPELSPARFSFPLPPTARQCVAIARLCRALGIREQLEDRPMSRIEAQRLQYDLLCRVRGMNAKG